MKSARITLLLPALILALALGLTEPATASPEEPAPSYALQSPPAQAEQTLAFWIDH